MNKLESAIMRMCDWMTMKGRDHKTRAQYSREARNYHRWLQSQPVLREATSGLPTLAKQAQCAHE